MLWKQGDPTNFGGQKGEIMRHHRCCCTRYCRIREKEIEKIEKYQNLKRELKRLWSLKKVEVVPVVVGALGCISKSFSGWMDTLGIKLNVGMVQKSVLLGTATILRKALDM